MIKAYIEDKDPEASLSIGADMRKINLSFQLFKVRYTVFGNGQRRQYNTTAR